MIQSAQQNTTVFRRNALLAFVFSAIISCIASAESALSPLPKGLRSNIAWGDTLNSLPPVPPGFRSQKSAARALREHKIQHTPKDEPIPDNVSVKTNIEYAKASGAALTLDLYLPQTSKNPSPLLVLIHGGAWDHGDKSECARWAAHFAARGYIAASIDYRLTQVAPYPAAVDDVHAALNFLRNHTADYAIDGNRIALVGFSAGAHLAMLAAYEPRKDDPKLTALVDFYGPPDLTVRALTRNKAVSRFLGAKLSRATTEKYLDASPITHLTANALPTLILHGTVDSRVPIKQSDALADALAKLNVPYLYDRQPGWHHAMDEAAASFARCEAVATVFLNRFVPVAP